MEWILCAIGCVILMAAIMFVIMYIELKPDKYAYSSEYILSKFEPTEISPTITEMIEFHKSNKLHKE